LKEYRQALQTILDSGRWKGCPQADDALTYSGIQMRFDLTEGFPLLTLRSLQGSWKAMRVELLWILSGSTQVSDLQKQGVHFWDQWNTPETTEAFGRQKGDLGPIYGHQWRRFGAKKLSDGTYEGGFDQINWLIEQLKSDPNSRRHRITAWNPADQADVWITTCHGDVHINYFNGDFDMVVNQRAGDMPVGVPFDIAEYALFALMIGQVTGYSARNLVYNVEDAHIYRSQLGSVQELLMREPLILPTVRVNPAVTDIFGFTPEDFELVGYAPHPAIKDIPVLY